MLHEAAGWDVTGENLFFLMFFREDQESGGFPSVRKLITSAERELKVSRRSGMYQSYNFLTRLGMQSL